MTSELTPYLPMVLALSFGVLAWAILCAIERKRRQK